MGRGTPGIGGRGNPMRGGPRGTRRGGKRPGGPPGGPASKRDNGATDYSADVNMSTF